MTVSYQNFFLGHWLNEVSESASIKMCFTIIIKITLIFHPKAPRLGIVAEYKLRRLFTKNWETLGGEHANLPSSSSSRLRWKENWKLQISCQTQTVWTRRLMTGANITQFQTKSSLSPWPQASQERLALLYRLIEELITSELIYRFLASFIIRANLSSCDSLNCGVLGLQFHTPQKLVGEPRAYFAYFVDLSTQAASQWW